MKKKKTYIWQLADFLVNKGVVMSGPQLASHLNLNGMVTEYGAEYQGARGTYRLIEVTWHWLHDDLNLPEEAKKVATAFVKPDGSYAYE